VEAIMKFSLNLIESDSDIKSKILTEMRNHLQQAMVKSIPSIRKLIPSKIKDALMREPEYQSLINGKLKGEFGLSNASQKVNDIIDIWTNNVRIIVIPVTISGSKIKGGFKLDMIDSSYDDVLANDGAIVIDGTSGIVLPWLEWLLLYGNKIIVKNYEVQVGSNPRSRSGMAIMVPSKNNWRVPPEFAGTPTNNWVTRALSRLDDSILDIIQKEIEKHI
jgi:hypothetical protein